MQTPRVGSASQPTTQATGPRTPPTSYAQAAGSSSGDGPAGQSGARSPADWSGASKLTPADRQALDRMQAEDPHGYPRRSANYGKPCYVAMGQTGPGGSQQRAGTFFWHAKHA